MMSLKQAQRIEAKAHRRWKRLLAYRVRQRGREPDYAARDRAYDEWAVTSSRLKTVRDRYEAAGKIKYVPIPF